MIVSKYDSNKIKVLSFISIIFVIYIHSPYIEGKSYPVVSNIQSFVTDFGLSIFAVPLFFFISGFLFFKNIAKCKDCFQNIKKRLRTLLLPYIIWNVVFVTWYVVMALVPTLSSYVNSDISSRISLADPLGTLSFLFVEPAGFHLWFLRDLMLFVLISPLLYFGLKKCPVISALVIFLALGWIPRMGLLYFALGGLISLHGLSDKLDCILKGKLTAICVMFYVVNAFLTTFLWSEPANQPANIIWHYYIQLVSILSVLAFWGGYNMLISPEYQFSNNINKITSYTFFVYLFHEPTFNIIKKLTIKFIGENEYSLSVLFLINPFIILAISIFVGFVFRSFLPKVYKVFVGSRV